MPRAFLLIRADPCYRRDSFAAGLAAAGYAVHGEPRGAELRDDVLVIWNRYSRYHALATRFEHAGARVIVAENGPLGRDWRGEHWYSLTLGYPNGAGMWPDGGPHRWESFGVPICEWRKPGKEIIILAQRGIGPPGVAQPTGWHTRIADQFRAQHPGQVRIREHPGERPAKPLEEDLADARFCVTWGSGAALKALAFGVPVVYGFSKWIGATAGSAFLSAQTQPIYPDRMPMFQRLAWSMFRTQEIATGRPFQHLLALPYSGSMSTTAPR